MLLLNVHPSFAIAHPPPVRFFPPPPSTSRPTISVFRSRGSSRVGVFSVGAAAELGHGRRGEGESWIEEDNKFNNSLDLSDDGDVYRNTLRLVECAMFASVGGLAYLLSNSLAIEVATAMLLLTLSGPVKASTYLFMHGLVGLAMGSMWRLRVKWTLSIAFCTLVRAIGAIGYVLISSFLIRENILALITINIHASLTYILAGIGVNMIPSMNAIYAIFGTVLLLNCGFFVFLLHILYAVFLSKLGMKDSLSLPTWIQKAL